MSSRWGTYSEAIAADAEEVVGTLRLYTRLAVQQNRETLESEGALGRSQATLAGLIDLSSRA